MNTTKVKTDNPFKAGDKVSTEIIKPLPSKEGNMAEPVDQEIIVYGTVESINDTDVNIKVEQTEPPHAIQYLGLLIPVSYKFCRKTQE